MSNFYCICLDFSIPTKKVCEGVWTSNIKVQKALLLPRQQVLKSILYSWHYSRSRDFERHEKPGDLKCHIKQSQSHTSSSSDFSNIFGQQHLYRGIGAIDNLVICIERISLCFGFQKFYIENCKVISVRQYAQLFFWGEIFDKIQLVRFFLHFAVKLKRKIDICLFRPRKIYLE